MLKFISESLEAGRDVFAKDEILFCVQNTNRSVSNAEFFECPSFMHIPNLRVSHFPDMPLPECECVTIKCDWVNNFWAIRYKGLCFVFGKLYQCWQGLWYFIHARLVRALQMNVTSVQTMIWRGCIGPNAERKHIHFFFSFLSFPTFFFLLSSCFFLCCFVLPLLSLLFIFFLFSLFYFILFSFFLLILFYSFSSYFFF
jgi:hypothetical protein